MISKDTGHQHVLALERSCLISEKTEASKHTLCLTFAISFCWKRLPVLFLEWNSLHGKGKDFAF